MFSTAPFIHFSLSNWPSGNLGVWHSWQRATSSVRYFPRAILLDCAQPWQTKRHVETNNSLQRLIEANGTTKRDFGFRMSDFGWLCRRADALAAKHRSYFRGVHCAAEWWPFSRNPKSPCGVRFAVLQDTRPAAVATAAPPASNPTRAGA